MKIQLAYPYEGYVADDVIEVGDAAGRQMVFDGRARAASDDAEVSDPVEAVEPELFDPTTHTVKDVLDYLETNPADGERVLTAEHASEDRKTIASWTPPQS